MLSRKRWSVEETNFLHANNDTMPTWEMAKLLNRSPDAILCKCSKLGLKRSAHFKRDPEKIAAMPKRQYRPSPNQLPPGLHKYGGIKKERYNYWWIKIEGYKPMLYHHYIWIQAGREIPAGHKLMFKDDNKDNVTLDNLQLVKSPSQAGHVKKRITENRKGKGKKTEEAKLQRKIKYNEKRRAQRRASKKLGKPVEELSFLDKVLMGVI